MRDHINWCAVVFCCVQIGDLQSSYTAAQRSEDAFPEHVDTQEILKHLRQHFAVLWATDQHTWPESPVYLCDSSLVRVLLLNSDWPPHVMVRHLHDLQTNIFPAGTQLLLDGDIIQAKWYQGQSGLGNSLHINYCKTVVYNCLAQCRSC